MIRSREYNNFFNPSSKDLFGYPDTLVLGRTNAAYKFGCKLVYDCKVDRILDLGSGHGHGIKIIIEELQPNEIISTENEFDFLKAQKLMFGEKQKNTNIHFVNLDCCNLPFASSSIDVVFLMHVIEHLKNPEEALGEIKRVLNPDGKFIIATPWKQNIVGRNPNDEHVYTNDELKSLLRSAGFNEQTFS